ncbi:glycoside hydrolase family 92 protein [Methylobacterium soli]|jgi:hypothetical protein|uniref:Glycoside hydrolase family 92 protein n=1 Tax=Methylobacterium soli TaxID=553447 RepID=A0A6L3SYL2_9HYPH|nr:glycoside hydrolase family 92 protein [Methylobacterium soli]KAB1079158.1 glycoside hydrolase family 92 protein [Methylobacterium soli]
MTMQPDWISIAQVARELGIDEAEARALAERMRWPTVFKADDTLVLPPRPLTGG